MTELSNHLSSLQDVKNLTLFSQGLYEPDTLSEHLLNREDLLNQYVLNQHNAANQLIWFLMLKTVLSSLGAVAFTVTAIKWLQKMYSDDVRMMQELEQYGYDINRASWAIETIMEMQITKNLQPPEAWINAVCGGLFTNETNDNQKVESPIESLLNSSAKVELSTDGSKFEMTSRGAKKLAKKAANE